jgi:[acyl-carrier-protein] S-malonyltransferase
MKPAGAAGVDLQVPRSGSRIPVVANVDAEPKRSAAESMDALIRQVSSPVRWQDVVAVGAEGAPVRRARSGNVLAGLIRKIDVPYWRRVGDAEGLDAALAQLTAG